MRCALFKDENIEAIPRFFTTTIKFVYRRQKAITNNKNKRKSQGSFIVVLELFLYYPFSE